MNIKEKIDLYLNESLTQSVRKSLDRKPRDEKWMLVDKNGNEIPTIYSLKTYKTAYKAKNWEVKTNDYKEEDIYIIDRKRSTDEKIAVVFTSDQDEPNFDYKRIHA